MKNRLAMVFGKMRIVGDTYYSDDHSDEPKWTMPPPCHSCTYGVLQPLKIGHRMDCLLTPVEMRDTKWYKCYRESYGQIRVGEKPALDKSEVIVECEDCGKRWKALKYYVEDKYVDGKYVDNFRGCPYCRIGR